MAEQKSDFGKGFVYNLVLFAMHLHNRFADRIFNGKSEGIFLDTGTLITTWANGASDHLYEIEIPERYKGTEIETKVLELKRFGLEIGHGFIRHDYTKKDFMKLSSLTKEIALLVDTDLGVEPIAATWE